MGQHQLHAPVSTVNTGDCSDKWKKEFFLIYLKSCTPLFPLRKEQIPSFQDGPHYLDIYHFPPEVTQAQPPHNS